MQNIYAYDELLNSKFNDIEECTVQLNLPVVYNLFVCANKDIYLLYRCVSCELHLSSILI